MAQIRNTWHREHSRSNLEKERDGLITVGKDQAKRGRQEDTAKHDGRQREHKHVFHVEKGKSAKDNSTHTRHSVSRTGHRVFGPAAQDCRVAAELGSHLVFQARQIHNLQPHCEPVYLKADGKHCNQSCVVPKDRRQQQKLLDCDYQHQSLRVTDLRLRTHFVELRGEQRGLTVKLALKSNSHKIGSSPWWPSTRLTPLLKFWSAECVFQLHSDGSFAETPSLGRISYCQYFPRTDDATIWPCLVAWALRDLFAQAQSLVTLPGSNRNRQNSLGAHRSTLAPKPVRSQSLLRTASTFL